MRRWSTIPALSRTCVWALLVLGACEGAPPPDDAPEAEVVAEAAEPEEAAPREDPAAHDGPRLVEGVATAAPASALPAPPPLSSGAPKRISARHILIDYVGAEGVPAERRRSRAEALAEAQRLKAELDAGADFAKLAQAHSNDGSATRGGQLGSFGRGAMVEAFERAAFALEVGQTSDIVETPFGFHIIRRELLAEVRLAHVLVQWAGLPTAETERTEEEARARVEQARAALLAGQPITEVAPAFSDGETGPRGGELGWFQKGHLMPEVDAAAFSLKRGGVSEVVQSAAGFHVLVRLE